MIERVSERAHIHVRSSGTTVAPLSLRLSLSLCLSRSLSLSVSRSLSLSLRLSTGLPRM
eukprot:COSAG03_NODE_24080_length_275_cov_0.573864_1_plen_58_part_10